MPPKTIRRGDDRPSTDSPHCQHPSSPFQIPSFNTASAAGYSGINMGTGAVGTAVGGALTDLPAVPVPTSAASGTLSALSWLMAPGTDLVGSERQKNLGNLRVFCSDVDVSKKKCPRCPCIKSFFCINLWLRMVLKYQLMGKIGGDWTAHDLGTSHSNQVRSLQKKTKTVQVTWPFSIKTLLEVEKNLLPKLGI